MSRFPALGPVILWLLIGVTPAKAQVKPEVIELGKRATALVEVVTEKGQATGSAFCIDKSGLFVTNAHVIEGAGPVGQIQLVLDIGTKTQRSLRATPLWINEEQDLALLKVQPRGIPLVSLTLGQDGDLKEGAEVTTFGFPFGQQIALDQSTYPEVSVNVSQVTFLRKEKDRLGTIKFDGQLNPGNSGGPVLGHGGEVVGVAVATVLGGGINFAIPVGQLTKALNSPGLQFLMPPLAFGDRMRPTTWQFRAIPPWPIGKLPDGLTVALTLAANVGAPRTFTCRPLGNGEYRVTLTPVPSDRDRKILLQVRMDINEKARVDVKDKAKMKFNDPTDCAVAEVNDCDVTVGPRRFRLRDLSSIHFNPGFNQEPYVTLVPGGGAKGSIRGLGAMTWKRKTKRISIDLTQMQRIDVVAPRDAASSTRILNVLAELRKDETTLATCHKVLDFTIPPMTMTATTVSGDFVVLRPAWLSTRKAQGGSSTTMSLSPSEARSISTARPAAPARRSGRK